MKPLSSYPLVSIVTPCFNSAEYLELCIRSVQLQTYPNVEHIVQDGASTDGTRQILERYNGEIDWVSEEDQGQADGLDRALKRCKGELILVLNADDELLPHACEWGVKKFVEFPNAAVVYGDQYNIDLKGEIVGEAFGPNPYNFEALFCVEEVIPAQAAFIKRSALEEVGVGTDPHLRTCPDFEMWVRLGLRFPMQYAPGLIARYRFHEDSEGQQARMVPLFIEAKKSIMVRTWEELPSDHHLKRLRKRAYSGLYRWASFVAMSHGDVLQSGRLFITSMRWRTDRKTLFWLAQLTNHLPLWKRFPLLKQILKRCVKGVRQSPAPLRQLIRRR